MIVLYSTEGQLRLFEATVLDLISKRGLAVGVGGGGERSERWGEGGERSERRWWRLPSEARLPPVGLASSRRRRRIASEIYFNTAKSVGN